MAEELNMILTLKRKSARRRKWREWWTLLQWGLRSVRKYEDHDMPVDVGGKRYGYLGPSILSRFGRRSTFEMELIFFEPMKECSDKEQARMQQEMREALGQIALKHGYEDFGWREAKPTFLA